MYLLKIEIYLKHVRQYKFVFGNQFPTFKKLKSIIKPSSDANTPHQVLCFVIKTNSLVENVVSEFVNNVRTNIPDQAGFYPKHPEKYFLQTGDYPMSTD